MDKKLIIFEGLPGSGKSTLTEYFSVHFAALKIPEILPIKKTQELSWFNYFKLIEINKFQLFLESNSVYNFMDRHLPSICAYEYSKQLLGLPNKYKEAMNLSKIKDFEFKEKLYIYLKIPYQLSNFRKRRFETKKDIWTVLNILQETESFYETYFQKRTDVRTIDASKPLGLVKKEIYEIIQA